MSRSLECCLWAREWAGFAQEMLEMVGRQAVGVPAVAPRAGAWIEAEMAARAGSLKSVAPRAGGVD